MFQAGFCVEHVIKTIDVSEFDGFTLDAASECEDKQKVRFLKIF